MRLLIIRHGDPDYEKDSLTQKGWREARLLADRLSKIDVTKFYTSPLGRAKDTAAPTLERVHRTAEECEWLREFGPHIKRPDVATKDMISWDWLPEDWTAHEEFFRRDLWASNEIMQASTVSRGPGYSAEELHTATGKRGVGAEYDWVCAQFDALLERHGYVREGDLYHARRANRDTIVLFCHFGIECVLLSHLMNVSPMILWHHLCAAPSSVTSIYTEERREGIAIFRVGAFGDISHLYAGGEEPAFAARFCETYDCREERHD